MTFRFVRKVESLFSNQYRLDDHVLIFDQFSVTVFRVSLLCGQRPSMSPTLCVQTGLQTVSLESCSKRHVVS